MTGAQLDRVGVVLAGGYSTRFGPTEKALVPIDGEPMLRRVVDRIEPVTDAVIVTCRSEQRASFTRALSDSDADIVFAIDPVDDLGPLAGTYTGLSIHDASETALLACDQPFVRDCVLQVLRENLGSSGAVVIRSDDQLQPTPAMVSTPVARRAAAEALADGQRHLLALFDRLDVREVDAGCFEGLVDEDPFKDVDRPTDLRNP